ncbi:MAG: FCD domain-containing protein [Anaerolineae bacterium]|nr:FCD domain-containing protein [Anaerolineae bacterium]NIQ80302.1 FCD domain-containing protein [Anaerolineae bacterium]
MATSTDLYSPVKRQERLPDQVADQIKDLILSKQLKVGDRLPPERELCEHFDVSRTVVREAMRILEAKSLLTSQSGSGTYVIAVPREDVIDSIGMYITTQGAAVSHAKLMEVRRLLEVQIASLAAERAELQTIQELDELLAKMEETRDDPRAFARLDLEFHIALARATGNELLEILLDPFMDALYEGRRLSAELVGAPEEAIQLHRGILEQVRAGNTEGAAQAMSVHLDQSERVTGRALAREVYGSNKLSDAGDV